MAPKSAAREVDNSPGVFLAAAMIGVVSGLICVLLRFGLRFLQWAMTGHSGLLADAASSLPMWRRGLTPVLGAIAATLIVKASRTYFHTVKPVDYVEAVRFQRGRIPFRATVWRTIASCFSIASGAAIGREGSMIQFSAASIAALGVRWKARPARVDRLVSLGTAAAVAAVYQAPLAGALFAIEIVLGLKAVSRESLIQMPALLLSSCAGAGISYLCLGSGPLFAVATGAHFSWRDSGPVLLCAIIIGSLSPVYRYLLEGLRFMKKLPWAMVWSGVVVGLLSCLMAGTWGNGDSGVLHVLGGRLSLEVAATLLVLRLGATAACVGSGVIGGVFTPTVFAGSVLGLLSFSCVHVVFGLDSSPVGYEVLGIACLLSSVTHAPLMAALMAVELTGTWQFLPIVLLCTVLSFQIARTLSPGSLYAVATPDPARVVRETAT